jgi:hypothetical protein
MLLSPASAGTAADELAKPLGVLVPLLEEWRRHRRRQTLATAPSTVWRRSRGKRSKKGARQAA